MFQNFGATTDPDTIDKSGIYYFTAGTIHAPEADNGYIVLHFESTNRICQIATINGKSSNYYIRIKTTFDSAYSDWKKILTDADFFQPSEYLNESTTIKTIQAKMDKITRNRIGFATVAWNSPLVGNVDTGTCIYNLNSALILTSSRIGVFRNTSESVKWIGDENLSLSPTTNFDEITKSGYGWLNTFGATYHGTGSPGAIRTGEGVFESIVYSSTIILQRWNVNGYGVMFRQKTGSSWQSWRSIPYV